MTRTASAMAVLRGTRSLRIRGLLMGVVSLRCGLASAGPWLGWGVAHRRGGGVARTRTGRVGVQALAQVIGDEIHADPAGPAVQVAEDALAVAEGAQARLVLLRLLQPEQRQHVRYLGAFRRPEREDAGDAVGDLLIQQITGVLRDHDQRGVARPAHPGD